VEHLDQEMILLWSILEFPANDVRIPQSIQESGNSKSRLCTERVLFKPKPPLAGLDGEMLHNTTEDRNTRLTQKSGDNDRERAASGPGVLGFPSGRL
jgi:hypothetical protein